MTEICAAGGPIGDGAAWALRGFVIRALDAGGYASEKSVVAAVIEVQMRTHDCAQIGWCHAMGVEGAHEVNPLWIVALVYGRVAGREAQPTARPR
jgi:hypothetical protein